jgi:predicted phosphoribosyltransferase
LLADLLRKYADREDVLVLALPRGGVPVGFEVANRLNAPMDVFVVRKLGVPGHSELAMGAIATGGVRVLNESVVRHLGIPDEMIDAVAAEEEQELRRREALYRGHDGAPNLKGKTVILVDDGIATGSTMYAAVQAIRKQHPRQLIVAVPTAAPSSAAEFESVVDEFIAVMTPEPFLGVGQWYDDFSQTSDAEVRHLLGLARTGEHSSNVVKGGS